MCSKIKFEPMKRIFYTIFGWLMIIAAAQAQGNKQDFEGIITYRLIIEAKNPMLNTRNLQAMFGDTMRLYLKENNYKMAFTGTYAREILYTGDENKHYITLGPIDSLVWRYCNEHASSAIYTSSTENAGYIMDYKCNSYAIQTDWGLTTYYYSPQLKLDPKKYKQHIFNYFNVYVQYAQAPYLKYVYSGPSFKLTLVAVDIQKQQIERTAFHAKWSPVSTADNITK